MKNVLIKGNTIIIEKPIITINDSENVIHAIKEAARNFNNIVIDVKNSFSFPSSIIAVLEKLKDEGKKVTIKIKDPVLYELFKDLNLDQMFTLIKD